MIQFSISSMRLQDFKAFTPLDVLINREEESNVCNMEEAIAEGVASMNLRSRDALLARYSLHPKRMNVSQLAKKWGVSRQRVYQIANEAVANLREQFRSDEHDH